MDNKPAFCRCHHCVQNDDSFYPAHPTGVIAVSIADYFQRFEYRHVELVPTKKLICHLATIREKSW